ncbi:MAG: hypothetical protein GXO09_01820 [Crenarchaeota archaeon]|nr:hypothetical protein [Thermoproteota archaeon]
MKKTCILCGKETETLIENLCPQCYLRTHRLLDIPERIEVEYCKYCGAYRYGHKWLPGGEPGEAAKSFIEKWGSEKPKPLVRLSSYRLVEARPETTPSWHTVFTLTYEADLEEAGVRLRQGYRVELYLRPTICPSCKNARGGDYDVVLQIRAPTSLLREVYSELNRLSSDERVVGSIVDYAETRRGLDLYMDDKGAASRILSLLRRYFRLRVRRTAETVGTTSTGLLRRRTVYSVRVLGRRNQPTPKKKHQK